MLSIHSLASDLGSDPRFLLSNLEISRVAWKRGARANELVVEINLDACSSGFGDSGTYTPPIELSEFDVAAVDACALRETRSHGPLGPLSPGVPRSCFASRTRYPPGIHVAPRIYAARDDKS